MAILLYQSSSAVLGLQVCITTPRRIKITKQHRLFDILKKKIKNQHLLKVLGKNLDIRHVGKVENDICGHSVPFLSQGLGAFGGRFHIFTRLLKRGYKEFLTKF